jgi:hypothetical protein
MASSGLRAAAGCAPKHRAGRKGRISGSAPRGSLVVEQTIFQPVNAVVEARSRIVLRSRAPLVDLSVVVFVATGVLVRAGPGESRVGSLASGVTGVVNGGQWFRLRSGGLVAPETVFSGQRLDWHVRARGALVTPVKMGRSPDIRSGCGP